MSKSSRLSNKNKIIFRQGRHVVGTLLIWWLHLGSMTAEVKDGQWDGV